MPFPIFELLKLVGIVMATLLAILEITLVPTVALTVNVATALLLRLTVTALILPLVGPAVPQLPTPEVMAHVHDGLINEDGKVSFTIILFTVDPLLFVIVIV